MTTLVLSDYRRDEQASPNRRVMSASVEIDGKWCEVRAESTSRLKAIAALALAAIRPATPIMEMDE